jgi:site-specific recombinase XerD
MAKKISRDAIEKAKVKDKPYEVRGQHGLILRVQPTGRKVWYCEIGRGRRQRIGDATVLTLERAEYRAREILNEAADNTGNVLKRDPVKSLLGGFIDEVYAPWVRANRRRAEICLTDLRRSFGAWYEKRMTDITSDDLDDYVSRRMKEGASAATIVRDLNNLRSVFRQAIIARYARDNPFANWTAPAPEEQGAARYLTAEEEARLRRSLRQRDDVARRGRTRANKWRLARGYELLPQIPRDGYSDHLTPMVLTSINCGLRYGELAGLEWSAVDLGANVLTVTGRTAKGAKTRHIPLNAEALDVLKRWRGEGLRKGLVFSNPDGSRIGSVKTAWASLLIAADINDFRWHDLRHSFASKLVQRGVSLPVVCELLGHSDFKLTLRYSHLDEKTKADAVARLM